jgi:glycosyltransferase involved in cell wall biosynthesis
MAFEFKFDVQFDYVGTDISMKPEVTLAIITHNSAKYIQETINSILESTIYPNAILFYDNASTDLTTQIIERNLPSLSIKSINVKLLRNQANSFASGAMKSCIEIARTEYLAILHGDDLLESNYFEAALGYLNLNPKVDVLNVSLQEFGDLNRKNRILQPLWTRYDLLNRILSAGLNPGLMPGAILKLEKFRGENPYHSLPLINGVEDTVLWAYASMKKMKIRSLNRPLILYRRHSEQTSSSTQMAFFSGIARRFLIDNAPNLFYRFLSKSEIRYEIKVFMEYRNEYFRGLSGQCFEGRFASNFRILNILARRVAKFLNILKTI